MSEPREPNVLQWSGMLAAAPVSGSKEAAGFSGREIAGIRSDSYTPISRRTLRAMSRLNAYEPAYVQAFAVLDKGMGSLQLWMGR